MRTLRVIGRGSDSTERPVVIKVGEEEELKCPTCGKPMVTAEEVVIVHTKTDFPFSFSDFVADSGAR